MAFAPRVARIESRAKLGEERHDDRGRAPSPDRTECRLDLSGSGGARPGPGQRGDRRCQGRTRRRPGRLGAKPARTPNRCRPRRFTLMIGYVVAAVLLVALVGLAMSVRILKQDARAVMFHLGELRT